jgi:hypothetical protein
MPPDLVQLRPPIADLHPGQNLKLARRGSSRLLRSIRDAWRFALASMRLARLSDEGSATLASAPCPQNVNRSASAPPRRNSSGSF